MGLSTCVYSLNMFVVLHFFPMFRTETPKAWQNHIAPSFLILSALLKDDELLPAGIHEPALSLGFSWPVGSPGAPAHSSLPGAGGPARPQEKPPPQDWVPAAATSQGRVWRGGPQGFLVSP